MDETTLYDFLLALQEDIVAGAIAPVETYVRRFPAIEAEVRLEYRRVHEHAELAGVSEEPRRIGSYQLLRELGRGGQGEVYLALDEALGRRVALKVLSSPLGSVSTDRRARFRREAKVVAQLDHPGVCSVYAADLEAEVPYIAMAFIEGRALGELVSAAARGDRSDASLLCRPTNAEELDRMLEFFESAARALHVAHEAGVVHRDVKPGNLMVTPEGCPVVVDFGLARADDPLLETLTKTDEVLGTPFYMAPEQLGIGRATVDARTDVYSLGATLYEALTLSPPFQATGWPELFRAIQHDPVPDARLANPALPHAVHAILATAMDKDPERRYATAAEFADDLARARERRSVFGRAPGRMLGFVRWTRRAPRTAAALAVVVVAAVLGAGWFAQFQKGVDAGDRHDTEQLAERFREKADKLVGKNPARALRYAYWASVESPGPVSDRVLLRALDDLWEERRIDARSWLRAMDVQRGSGLALSADRKGNLNFWNIANGKVVGGLVDVGEGSNIEWAAFHPFLELAASTSSDGTVALWLPAAAEWYVRLGGHDGAAYGGSFDPNGERLATCGSDGRVRVWDLARREELQALVHDESEVSRVAFSPRGCWLVSATHAPAGGVRLYQWDAETFERLGVWDGSAEPINHLAFLPDGSALVTASDDGTVRLWSTERAEGTLGAPLDHGVPVRHFDVDDDGQRLVTAHDPDGEGNAVTIWELDGRAVSSQIMLPLRVGASEVRLDPANERIGVLASNLSSDLSLYVYALDSDELLRRMIGHQRAPLSFRWAQGGDRIVSASVTKYLHVWYARARPFLPVVESGSAVTSLVFSADGSRLIATHQRGDVTEWDWRDLTLKDRRAAAAESSTRPDARFLDARALTGGVRIRVVATAPARIERENPATGEVTQRELAWPPVWTHIGGDGRVALSGSDGSLHFYDSALRGPVETWDEFVAFGAAAFSPNGLSFAAGSLSEVKRWSTETGELLLTYPHDAIVEAVTFGPNGCTVVVGLGSGAIKVWPVDVFEAARKADPWYNKLLYGWKRAREGFLNDTQGEE